MEAVRVKCLLLFLCSILIGGHAAIISYDYSATDKCLPEPEKPQYRGGIIVNPEFNDGFNGWTVLGKGTIEERISKRGNRFLVTHSRSHPSDSLSQKLYLEKEKFYVFSAWVQISKGNEAVTAVFKSKDGQLIHGGMVTAKPGCWSMMKGGIFVNTSSPVELYFKNKNAAVDIWVDSVSLQPFSKEQWRSHQDESIQKVRKKNVRLEVTDPEGHKLAGVRVSIEQIRTDFPLGCLMNKYMLTSTDYQNWFLKRFKYTAYGNEMKWYATETSPGVENYTISDALVAFCKKNNIAIRGHNVLWDDPKMQPWWVQKLGPNELRPAAARRVDSVVSRYSGQLIAWDVMNENMHFSYYEDMLGKNASAVYYARTHQLDPKTTLFLNEFNTVEYPKGTEANAEDYIKKLREIQDFPGNKDLPFGIGVEAHFGSGQPNIAYMRTTLDKLASTGFPIWLTEVDMDKDPNQAKYFEEILREGYAHPAVKGIIVFSGPELIGCERMCLTDLNFKPNGPGQVLDNLLEEWKSGRVEATTDSNGYLETSLFHGDYDLTVIHPLTNSSRSLKYKVETNSQEEDVIKVEFHV